MKILFIIFILLLNYNNVSAQSMVWLCKPGKFSEIEYIGYELFKVKDENNKWGIIRYDGKKVLSNFCDSITSYSEGRALVLDHEGEKINMLLNEKGEIIKDFTAKDINVALHPYFKDGMLGFKDSSGISGYLNKNGDIAIKAQFYLAAPFQKGIATVQYADGDGYYGLINKSGGSAIISDTKYSFLSSVVDGYLISVASSSRGGDVMRLMRLEGNQLKTITKLESKMFVDLSYDFDYLHSQNGHNYFIDSQWRIKGCNYDYELPYVIEEKSHTIVQTDEILSKHATSKGLQITYLGHPILENSFSDVETYEKKYAIVCGKDHKIGVLKLNPSSGMDIMSPLEPITFYHNNFKRDSYSKDVNPEHFVRLKVEMNDINPDQLKCYYNDNGYMYYAPLINESGSWNLHLPYFNSATRFGHTVTKNVDIAITYDGLDWMHKTVSLMSKHDKGFAIKVSGSNKTNRSGKSVINVNVTSLNGQQHSDTKIEILNHKELIFTGQSINIPLEVYVAEGSSRTFTYTVRVKEPGCPIIEQQVSKTITHEKHGENKNKNKEVILI